MTVSDRRVKVQLGVVYVVEVLVHAAEGRSPPEPLVPGYALFDLHDRQLSTEFAFFNDALVAASAMGLA
ncbi:MAG: hypothetical protein EOP72_07630 [Variovorax sp.]|jgi:hypothetical protein|nr:MAG: hypothetical protein EOP72_07630 [Variovorax sp.]